MVDLNPDIYRLLKGICRVSLEFPSVREEFPVITITEVSNTSDYIVEGKEMISVLRIKLMFGTTAQAEAERKKYQLRFPRSCWQTITCECWGAASAMCRGCTEE